MSTLMAMVTEPKILFSDVDGTLTDGRLYYGPNGEMVKAFNVKDGLGIKKWQKNGHIFAIITAKQSPQVELRASELGIGTVAMKIEDKESWIDNWLAQRSHSWTQVAYIGDDDNDLACIRRARWGACPADASENVQKEASFVCQRNGGKGAVREFIENLLIQAVRRPEL